ncbi:uncharacterized protein LOC144424572 [Styela clava]
MDFVKIVFFITLICCLLAAKKIPAGACVSKIVNGKLVQVGDCEKNDGSEIARLIKKSLDEKEKASRGCGVIYNSKCFRAVMYKTQNITFNDARSICKSMNNRIPANIHDFEHYQMLLTYLRSMIPAGRISIFIWTGMQYKNNQLLGGEALPNEVWIDSYPKSATSWTNVALSINKDENADQGIFNVPSHYLRFGVICEI